MTNLLDAAAKAGEARAAQVASALAETAQTELAESLQAEVDGTTVRFSAKDLVRKLAYAAPLAALTALFGKRA